MLSIQRYLCKDCGRRFSFNIGFEKMRATPQMVTSAMQLYFTGESFRNVKRFLELQGVKMSHVAVYKWIKKYVGLMQNYLEKIKPNVGNAWRTDELFLKVKGDMKYLYALMDDETRFWIAQQVSDTKYTANINPLFKNGKHIAGKRPNTLISDGAPNFNDAFKREFFTISNPRTRHIRHIRLQGDHNNNKMERFNGEVRDREKVMRGLKRTDTPILAGHQIYHNYMRPHEGLDGKTPTEVCGIQIEGENKWFKYSKWPLLGHINTPPEYASSRIIFNSSKRNNHSSYTPLAWGTTRFHKTDKHDFKRWIDYCGIFYFFIKYLKIKQQHYEHDVKPVFTKWAKLTIQPLGYHDFSATLEPLVIRIVDTIRGMDHDDMAASHLEGYKEYELLLLITYYVRKYNTSLLDFIKEATVHIQTDVAALVPVIFLYDIQLPQASNYYFLSNIFHYLWDKFWETEPEARLEIVENGERFELIQIPGRRRISLTDNRTQLQKLKEYIDEITGEIVYTLLSFEVERGHICKLVTDFSDGGVPSIT